MTLECINPKDLRHPEMYTQVVVATKQVGIRLRPAARRHTRQARWPW